MTHRGLLQRLRRDGRRRVRGGLGLPAVRASRSPSSSVGRTPEQLLVDAPAAQAAYVLREDLTNLDEVYRRPAGRRPAAPRPAADQGLLPRRLPGRALRRRVPERRPRGDRRQRKARMTDLTHQPVPSRAFSSAVSSSETSGSGSRRSRVTGDRPAQAAGPERARRRAAGRPTMAAADPHRGAPLGQQVQHLPPGHPG